MLFCILLWILCQQGEVQASPGRSPPCSVWVKEDVCSEHPVVRIGWWFGTSVYTNRLEHQSIICENMINLFLCSLVVTQPRESINILLLEPRAGNDRSVSAAVWQKACRVIIHVSRAVISDDILKAPVVRATHSVKVAKDNSFVMWWKRRGYWLKLLVGDVITQIQRIWLDLCICYQFLESVS